MVQTEVNEDKCQQKFLDSKQYSINGILCYEYIFGKGFISSGGGETTEEIFSQLTLKEGSRVLDIGCGIGGGCEQLASFFKAFVHGVDLSSNVIGIAKKRYERRKDLSFEVANAVTMKFPDDSFDMIYSRDALLHLTLENKKLLFNKCYKWLKKGGQLVITDYCCGPCSLWDDEFTNYVKNRQYTLLTIEDYEKILQEAQFNVTTAMDHSERWRVCLEDELKRLQKSKLEFLRMFSEKDLNVLLDGWKTKIERTVKGLQKWGLFIANK